MFDSNNKQIRLGDIVQITGGYFKTGNGLFFVSSEYNNSLYLHRIKKSGELCVNSATSAQSWPITSYCSDASKNRAAKLHNAEHAKIEVVDGVNTWYVAEHFRKSAQESRERAEHQKSMGHNEDAEQSEQRAAACDEIANRLAESAEQPKAKAPEKGIKFYWNGIKVDGGRLIPCYYSINGDEISIYTKNYTGLPCEYFVVKNDTDIMTDYFDNDRTTLTPEHPLYKYARYAALKNLCSGKSYRRPTDEQKDEFSRMKDPGSPTSADYAAIEEMKTAAESARIAAEHAAQLAEREKMLRARNEGRHFIESIMEQHPLVNGQPVVTICWSEHPAFYSWADDALKMSVAASEIVLRHFDEQKHAEHAGYDKTDFIITYTDPDTGELNTYEGRYDLGDNDGGLIEHIRRLGKWYRTHDEHSGKEIKNPPAELSEQERIADYLSRFTVDGQIVSVEIAPQVIDFMAEKKKREQQKAEQEMQDLYDAVGILTDEQLESAVMNIDPADAEGRDVARFFIQELARRDKDKALDVFRKWNAGA